MYFAVVFSYIRCLNRWVCCFHTGIWHTAYCVTSWPLVAGLFFYGRSTVVGERAAEVCGGTHELSCKCEGTSLGIFHTACQILENEPLKPKHEPRYPRFELLPKLPPNFRTNRYYLSKSWAGNLRRYVEAQARRRRSPSFASNSSNSSISVNSSGGGGGGGGGKEKRSRGRDRAESNLMPPWQDVNADLMCQHQGLAHSSQGTRGKVRCGVVEYYFPSHI